MEKWNWAVVVMLACVAFCRAGEPTASDGTDSARLAMEKWIEARRVLSKEHQDWALGREMLNERIELVQREIASLREKIGQAQESISEADTKRLGLVEEEERFKAARGLLGEIVAGLETRTAGLIVRLPDPIRDRIKVLSQSLPTDPNQTRLGLGRRFQNVVGILNEVNKFDREITVTSEVRTLADGTAAEVAALYLGLGQAYYTGANGTAAGVGRPSETGWKWEPATDAAGAIAEAIAILKNEKVADFVLLPVKVE